MKKILLLFPAMIMLLTSASAGKDISIGQEIDLHSEIMGEKKTIYVHLPEGYHGSGQSYPVLFQFYSHFTYSYFMPAVRATEQLGEHGKIPKMIVVGIKNQQFRYRDLLPVRDRHSGESRISEYLDYMEKELIPYLDNRYRTLNLRVLCGPQAGGAFGIYALATRPNLFQSFILSNPFWRLDAAEKIREAITDALKSTDLSQKVLLIHYTESEKPLSQSHLQDFSTLIRSHSGTAPQLTLHVLGPEQTYSDIPDIRSGLVEVFKGYEFPISETSRPLDVLKTYYARLSKKLGAELMVPAMLLIREGDKWGASGQTEEALKLYLYTFQIYPRSLDALHRLGTTYMRTGEDEKALFYLEKFLEIQEGNPMIKGLIRKIREKKPGQSD